MAQWPMRPALLYVLQAYIKEQRWLDQVFDKYDLLGTKALPLYSWMTKALPNQWGVSRIVFNYERFLVDAEGQPLRRRLRRA